MDWFDGVLSWVGAVLLPLSTVLLLEELTYGGLVRLLLALRPETDKHKSPKQKSGGGK
jgi:hypothetical protein